MNRPRFDMSAQPTSCRPRALRLRVFAAAAICLFPAAGTVRGTLGAEKGTAALSGETEVTARRGEAYYHLMRAQLALSRGRFFDVVREVKEAVALDPDSGPLHAEGAYLLLRLGQYPEAERMALRALQLEPDSRTALRVLADLAASKATGDTPDPEALREAIDLYRRLETLEEDRDGETLARLVQLELRAGDTGPAAAHARKLLSLRPGDPGSVRLLVQAFLQNEQPGEALDALLGYARRTPLTEDMLVMTEELARQTDAWERLARVLGEILADGREAPALRRLRGEALLRLGEPAEAAEELERARAASPDDPVLAQSLARAYLMLGRLAEARELVEPLVRAYPGALEPRLLLSQALERQGAGAEAAGELEACLELLEAQDGSTPEQRDWIRTRLAELALNRSDLEVARRWYGELEAPSQPEAVMLRAEIALQGRDPRGLRQAAASLEGGQSWRASALEAVADLLAGRPAATGALESLAAQGPEEARYWILSALDRVEAPEAQERFLRAWVQADPQSADARFALGGFLERQGRFPEAERELRAALEQDPRHGPALNYLGYSLADRNERLEEALQLIRRALDVDPWNGAYLDSLGWVYYRLGRYEEARAPLERAAREFPHDPVVLEHLGDVYLKLGMVRDALRLWRRALGASPEDPEKLQRKIHNASRAAGEPAISDSKPDPAVRP